MKKALMPEIEVEVFYADIAWTLLMKKLRKGDVSFREISKYPAVSRDLALLVDSSVEFAQIEQIARASEKKLLKSVTLFDVYEGDRIAENKKSVAYSLVLRAEDRTLTDDECSDVVGKVIKALSEIGAELRA